MANFSKLTVPVGTKKQQGESSNSQTPQVQLKDNREERVFHSQFSQIVNSKSDTPAVQKMGMETEEEELQLKGKTEEKVQMKSIATREKTSAAQPEKNNTGLPDQLKSGVEGLSGYSLDDVKVHYNSSQPAQLNAHAFAQGTDIHLGPGQEKHLPHEAWHVVQQKQGRVKATRQMKGKVPINDDAGLEKEADVMGGRALQRKKVAGGPQNSSSIGSIVQRNEDSKITDNRMNDLVKRVLQILSTLTEQGRNWEEIYGKQGGDLGEKGVKKAKGALLDSDKKKKGKSFKEKLITEALKRWFNELSTEDKMKVLKESGGVFSSIWNFGKSVLGSSESEKETQDPGKEEERNIEFSNIISHISLDDLEAFYSGYSKYGEIVDKVKEFERQTVDLAREIGSSVGAKVGEIRTEREFVSKFEEQKNPYQVARLEFEFLKESITDKARYKNELDALEDALGTRLNGPSMMIFRPELFSDKERMPKALESCEIALDNLKYANILRNATTSGLSNVGNWFKDRIDQVFGKSGSDSKETAEKQVELVSAIQSVCDKSWYSFTHGLFSFTPKGVTRIKGEVGGGGEAAQKLKLVKESLLNPEIELAEVENKLSSSSDDLSKTGKKLKSGLTEDKLLTETRTAKSTEKYGNEQIDNVSKGVDQVFDRGALEIRKHKLNKEIKGDNRHPLTQVFYNALKNMDPENLLSLTKTIAIMKEIGKELDQPKLTEK